MTFTKTLFEICIIIATLFVALLLVCIGTIPNVQMLFFVAHNGLVPLAALGLCIVVCGKLSNLTKVEWSGYWRASFLLVGGVLAVIFVLVTAIDLAQGSPRDILLNNFTVCVVGLILVGTSMSCRRHCPTCMPQLKALVTFNYL